MTPLQTQCLEVIKNTLATDQRFAGDWLKPSYVFGHIEIESNWNPTVKAIDYAKTGSVGLLQVTRETAITVGMGLGWDQTVPANSIVAGMRDLAMSRHALIVHYGANALEVVYDPYIVAAFNEGVGNIFKGHQDLVYVEHWRAAQGPWAYIDTLP